jgi:hypothetical protein
MAGYIGTTPVPQATQHRESFTATGGQTSFATAGYTPQFIDVYLNGVKLAPADYTATNGSDVVLASGATASDILEIVAYTPFEVANQTFTGTTTAANLTVTGAFTSQGIDDNADAVAITIDSSENVGIGTSSPVNVSGVPDLTVAGKFFTSDGTATNPAHSFTGDQNTGIFRPTTDTLAVTTAGSERMRIASDGSVGIGTSSPAQILHLASSTPDIRIQDTDGGYADINVDGGSIELRSDQGNTQASSTIKMFVDSTEAMRIDSSGNLLVGKTTQGLTNAGFEVAQSGQASATQSGASALRLNRLSSDGEILQFRKDGSTVGSIGTVSAAGDLYISSSDTDHAGLRFSYERILPYRNGTLSDGTVDLGQTSDNYRFKDLYLSGGVFLGGTGAANKLDEYEEGGWTPSFGNTGGVTYDQQSGRYTKIGRAVHIQGVIRWSAFTPSSNVFLGGLPFTPEGSDNFINSVSVFPANGTAYNVAYEYLSGGSLFFYNNSGSLGGSAASNPFGSSGSIIINGIYYA